MHVLCKNMDMESRASISSAVCKAPCCFNRASLLDSVEWIMSDIRLLHAPLQSRFPHSWLHIIQAHCNPKRSYPRRSFQMKPLYATNSELHVLVMHYAMTADDLVQRLGNGWNSYGRYHLALSSTRNWPTRDDRVISITSSIRPEWLMKRTVSDTFAVVRNIFLSSVMALLLEWDQWLDFDKCCWLWYKTCDVELLVICIRWRIAIFMLCTLGMWR